VVVYVPLEPLPELSTGISCTLCDLTIPTVFSAALTDVDGTFRIQAPAGENVPLVIQTGKWRRAITVPLVSPCVDNVIDDPYSMRLPRSQSEGNLPRIAVVTGFEDSLECFLRRVGIADREFTTPAGGGAVNLFVGCDGGSGTGADRFASSLGGEPFPDASSLFGNAELLRSYDFVFLGCEGSACENDKAPHHETIEGPPPGLLAEKRLGGVAGARELSRRHIGDDLGTCRQGRPRVSEGRGVRELAREHGRFQQP
jgi:hypothetical protein